MIMGKAYKEMYPSRINELKDAIASSTSKASTLSIEARIAVNKELDKLKGQQERFAALVQKLQDCSAESLQSAGEELDIIWSEIQEQLQILNDKDK